MERSKFEKELENLINKNSKENESNTPDYILAEYINGCLENFNRAVNARDKSKGIIRIVPGAKEIIS